MNYDNCNKIYDYWKNKAYPYLSHNCSVSSFDDYLKRFSQLPSGKWLRDMEDVKLMRLPFAIDSDKFFKKYKEYCVTYNSPAKAEDGIQRIIYQISPTFHAEVALWAWIEHDTIQTYCSHLLCFSKDDEFEKFSHDMWKIRKEGNTEDAKPPTGFLGFADDSRK